MANSSITPQNLWVQMLEKKHLLGFSNGFTIPFIVGAYYRREFLKEEDLQTSSCIKFLLEKVISTIKKGKEVLIFKCGNREKLVLQYISDGKRTEKDIESIKEHSYNIGHIIYLDFDVFRQPYSFETLVTELWNRYNEPIINHMFSYRRGDWQSFSRTEQKFIDTI